MLDRSLYNTTISTCYIILPQYRLTVAVRLTITQRDVCLNITTHHENPQWQTLTPIYVAENVPT